MALQPAAQTDMYNRRRQNRATGAPGSTTTAPVRPTEGAQGTGKSYYDYNANEPGRGRPTATQPPAGAPAAAPAPTPAPWTPYSPPGYGEDWWQTHKQQWDQPGQASNYWNGVQGYFTNPTQQEQNIQGYGSQMGNQTGSLEQLYAQLYGSGQFTNPGAGEQWWAQNGSQYGKPTGGETALGNIVGQYGQTGAMENWQAEHGADFNQTGDMEQFYRANVGKLDANNPLAQHQGGISNDINSARNTQSFFNAGVGDLLAPSYTEDLANRYRPQPSYNEQFLFGGGATQGLDQLYDRLSSQEARRLDTRAAAGGAFNSGAALRAQEESGKDFAAQHVKDYMAASQAADTSRIADQAFGLNLMQGADTGLRGRLSLGLSGANMADTQALGRARAGQDLYTGISDEMRANVGLAGDWANQAQAGALARTKAGADTANQANTAWLNRLAGETSAAGDWARQELDRLNSGGIAASRAQGDENQRVQTGLGAARDAQQAWMDRYKTAAGLEGDSQKLAFDRLMNGGTLAGQASNEDFTRYSGGQAAATGAQNSKQNRESQVLDNLLKVGGAQAGTTERQTAAARQEQAQFAMDQINGMLQSGQITAEELQAKYGAQMQALGLVIQGGKVVMGAMGGGPGLMAGSAGSTTSRGSETGGAGDNTMPINF